MSSLPNKAPPAKAVTGKGYLNAHPRLALSRWMLGPIRPMSPALHDVLLKEVSLSASTIAISLLNLSIFNLFCVWLTRSPWFAGLLALNLAFGIGRIFISRRISQASAGATARQTDAYILCSLAWFLLQGIQCGIAVASGNLKLEAVGAACDLGWLAPVYARNYGAPRFGMTLGMFLVIPLIIGCLVSPSRELLLIDLMAPGYILSSWTILRQFQDISLATHEGKMASEHQALHDPLTGALNRAGLLAMLDEAGAKYPQLAFFHLDLDDFKQVNDRFGHHAGDTLLQEVTERLRAALPADGVIARLGGDEFVILAPGFDPAGSARLAAKLVDGITGTRYRVDGDVTATVGVSIGFACTPHDTDSLAELYRKADAALYAAKADGKGAWRHFAGAA